MLVRTGKEAVTQIADRIKKELSKKEINAIKGSISLGFVTKENFEEDIERILKTAEEKMYKDKTGNRKLTNFKMIDDLMKTLHKRSEREKTHSINVSRIAELIAIEMKLPEKEVRKIADAAYYHDIGKIVLDERLLKKDTSLNDNDKIEKEKHPLVGYRILNLFDHTIDLAEGVLYHHEHWDGSGYPNGITCNAIPLVARIIKVAEVYETMINVDKMEKSQALAEIKKQAGNKLDPDIAEVLVNIKS